jgi:hypothetical protein
MRIRLRLPPSAQAPSRRRRRPVLLQSHNGPRVGVASLARHEWGVVRFLGPVRRYETCGDA